MRLTLPGVINVDPALMFTGLGVHLVAVSRRGVQGVAAVRPPAVANTQVAHLCKIRWGRDQEHFTDMQYSYDQRVTEAVRSIELLRHQLQQVWSFVFQRT